MKEAVSVRRLVSVLMQHYLGLSLPGPGMESMCPVVSVTEERLLTLWSWKMGDATLLLWKDDFSGELFLSIEDSP